MADVSIAEAKAKLIEIIARVEAGETQVITKRGKPVAKVVPLDDDHAQNSRKRRPFDWAKLKELVASQPKSDVSAGEFMRQLRDEARY